MLYTSRMICRSLVAMLPILLFTQATASANNTFFLPGDSFFFLRLGPTEMTRLHPERVWKLDYALPRKDVFFCGYAGYSKIQLTVPVEMRRSLGRAIKELVPKMTPDADGKVRAGVFVYNPDFSINKYRIGIQYNEKWPAETALFGHSANHVRLEDFVQTSDALMQNWRDGPRVAPLGVKREEIPESFRGAMKTPVIADDFQFIVVANRNYRPVFERKAGTQIVQVTTKGIQRYVAESSRWVAKKRFASP